MTARTASRVAWASLALFAAMGTAGLVLVALNGRGGLASNLGFVAVFGAMATVGAVVASRRPSNRVGWLFLGIGLGASVGFAGGEYAVYAYVTRSEVLLGREVAAWLSAWVWVPTIGSTLTLLPLLFPDGHPPSPRWRIVGWAAGAILSISSTLLALADRIEIATGVLVENPLGVHGLGYRWIDTVTFPLFLLVALPSVAALVVRFRRSSGEERSRLKWFTYGVGLLAGFFAETAILEVLGLGHTLFAGDLLGVPAFMAVPVGAGIGILRHRLFDIDLVIRKTLVAGVLVAFTTIVYGAVVLGVPALVLGVRPTGVGVLPLLAAVVLAIAFHPVRRRAQHWANRLVYGKRATPYEVLSEFAEWMSGTFAADELLLRTARILGEGTGAERTDVWLRVGDQLRLAASWPSNVAQLTPLAVTAGAELPPIPGADAAYPVRHQGQLIGAVSVRKPRDEPLTEANDRLVAHVAGQAGLVLRNARLTEELRETIAQLRASRQRLVRAQDEERRRIERDIHDGAQQQLVALSVQLRLLEQQIDRDPRAAKEAAGRLRAAATEALEDLRDLARGIYPPLLADEGLGAALEAQARKASLPVTVEADGIGRYPAEVEAAVYFCVLEALQNAAKYAEASEVRVRLSTERGELAFGVEDDGRGFEPAATRRGTGLQNMADRIEALGGSLEVRSSAGEGTTVLGRTPIPAGAAR